ncbi:MAG TPA: peptidoglycan DD-metalloendopeptidase family protein [Gemmatimonadaceae bacterium]|nr:peptidoglycan DD-metalloendopeptidase family protein [Gemmatimonadaceae bacterium]
MGAQQPTPEARLRADRAELDSMRAERSELEHRMTELRTNVHDLAEEVQNLDRQAELTGRAVKTLDTELAAITADVDEATANLVRSQDELAIKRALLQQRVVQIYKRGPLYSVQALFGAQSFGDLIARYKYLHLLALRDQALVTRVEALTERIARQRRVLVGLEHTIAETRSEKAGEESRLRRLETERAERLEEAKRSQKETEARLREIANAESHLGSVINTIEEARRRAEAKRNAPAPAASTLTTHDLGRLDWPVEGRILYRFGRVVNPNNTTTRWNGIGIAAAAGTSVHAVASGRVVIVQQIGTYGLTVIVQHGGGDYSVYGSLSRADVRKGQQVNAGDTIGAVGRADPDLQAHLHFEIRRNQGGAVDPLDWLKGGKGR